MNSAILGSFLTELSNTTQVAEQSYFFNWLIIISRSVNKSCLLAAINIKSFALKNNLSGEHTLKNQDELLTLVKVLTPEAQPIGYAVGG